VVSHDESHQQYRIAIGPYVLGQLDPAEQAWMESHLASCPACRREVAEVAPVASLLLDASPTAGQQLLDPPDDLGGRIEAEIGRLQAAERRRHRWQVVGLAAAGAVAASVVFGAGWVAAPDAPPAAKIPLEHVDVRVLDRDVDAEADIVAHTWGVEVKLHGSGFDDGAAYEVSILTAAGTRSPAGEFVGTGARGMDCNLNSSVLRAAATGFEVRDESGAVVVTSAFGAAD